MSDQNNLPARAGTSLPAVQPQEKPLTFPAGSIVNDDGTSVLLVRETGRDGALILAKATLKLSTQGGGLVEIGYGDNKSYMVDYKGLLAANQIAGLSVVTPDLVAGPGGRTECNPYTERDANGYIERVYLRKMAIGLSPLGNLCVADTTLVLEAKAYFMESLAKVISKYPMAGTVGHADAKPEGWTRQPTRWDNAKKQRVPDGKPESYTAPSTLRYYPGPMGMGIWADIAHEEVMALMNQVIQGERFFVRKAETIAERRVLSKHPAINLRTLPASKIGRDGSATISVVYRHNPLDQQQQQQLANRLARGEQIREVQGQMIEVEAETVEKGDAAGEAIIDDGAEQAELLTEGGEA